jgi:hypothetical protein
LSSRQLRGEVSSIPAAVGTVEAVHDAVVALVDVFVEVFHARDGGTDLHDQKVDAFSRRR